MAIALTSSASRAETAERATSKNWVLGLTSVASFMVALDALVVATALSTIRREFGASIEALQWTVNAYNLSFAVLLLTGAALGDYVGRRKMFLVGLGVFTAASAACALSPSVEWLIAARAAQGAGGAMVMPLAMALLSATFEPQERARALGIFSGLTGLALIGGPVIGGAIVQGAAWQWIFLLNVPIGILTIIAASTRIGESFGSKASLDIPGLVLASGASLAMVWGLARANLAGWASMEVAGSLGAGVALLLAFLAWERRTAEPMIPLRLFRARAFSAANASSFLFSAALYGNLFFVAQFLQTAQGLSPFDAGVRLLPWTATLFVFAPIAGRLVSKVGERPLVFGGLVLQALGMAWLGRVVAPDVPFVALIVPFIIAGAGVSMAMPAAQNSVVSAVRPSEIGKASGTYNTVRFLGGAFGIALSATVFGAFGGFGSPAAFTAGFGAAVTVAAALSLGGAVAGALLPARAR
jgi:EmrB/QacA subfamily drug resistance transporter